MSEGELMRAKTTYNSETKTWSGPEPVQPYNPRVSVGEIILQSLAENPHNIGQICHEDGYQMTNWEIHRDSVRVALSLRELGMKEGDVLTFCATNSRSVASVVFGALLNGITIQALDPDVDYGEMFKLTSPKVFVCDKQFYHAARKALVILNNSAPIFVFPNDFNEIVDDPVGEWKSILELLRPHNDEDNFVPPSISDGTTLPGLIFCSAGTTGIPKSIPMTHAGLFEAYPQVRGFNPEIRAFSCGQISWQSGIAVLFSCSRSNFTRVITRQTFSPKLVLEAIRKHRFPVMMCTPAQLQILLMESFDKEDLESLIIVLCTGGPIPRGLEDKFNFAMLDGYGCSEFGGLASCGQLAEGVVMRIVDDEGNYMGVGECGEICIRRSFPSLGYYGDKEATESAMKDGFLCPGDIGMFDENGDLHIIGRKTEIFTYCGIQVVPNEIEKELDTFEGVAMVCVTGIPDFSGILVPAALIVRTKNSEIMDVDVHEHIKKRLADHQWLRGGVYFVKRLPMTPSGKILRRLVAETALKFYFSSQNGSRGGRSQINT